MRSLFCTSYWPNIRYFAGVLAADEILIEAHESYHKQSWRNRTVILSANGPLTLTVPVHQPSRKIDQIKISYATKWQLQHWRAITSAYKKSPYFDFMEEEVREFYSTQHESLLDYNTSQLLFVLKVLRIPKKTGITEKFEKAPGCLDLRHLVESDGKTSGATIGFSNTPTYRQVFNNKFGFIPGLSILDLLFNEGLNSRSYLLGE